MFRIMCPYLLDPQVIRPEGKSNSINYLHQKGQFWLCYPIRSSLAIILTFMWDLLCSRHFANDNLLNTHNKFMKQTLLLGYRQGNWYKEISNFLKSQELKKPGCNPRHSSSNSVLWTTRLD